MSSTEGYVIHESETGLWVRRYEGVHPARAAAIVAVESGEADCARVYEGYRGRLTFGVWDMVDRIRVADYRGREYSWSEVYGVTSTVPRAPFTDYPKGEEPAAVCGECRPPFGDLAAV